MKNILWKLFIICLSLNYLILCQKTVYGWNGPGHMTIGAITYFELKENNPEVLQKLLPVIKLNHFYKTWWKNRTKFLPENEDLVVFMYLMRWADEDTDCFIGKHHYKDIPYLLNEGSKTVNSIQPDNDNIEFAFQKNLKLIDKIDSPAEEKAIALAWLFHLVGDSHQPLHSISLFSTQFPKGDDGGNAFKFKFLSSKAKNLHSFWDSLAIDATEKDLEQTHFQIVIDKANKLREIYPRKDFKIALGETSMKTWLSESYKTGVENTYQEIILNGTKIKKKSEVEFKERLKKYETDAAKIAEVRLTLAAYRLTDLCKILADKIQ